MKLISVIALVLAFAMPVQSQNIDDPKEVVKAVADKVLSEILANKEKLDQGPEFLLGLVETHMLPIIDQEQMSKMALKGHWNTITEQQQKNFIEGFKRLMIKTYAGAFKAYTGQKVSYSDTKFNKSRSKAIVSSAIHMAGGSLVNLQYRLYQAEKGKWMVYDANLAGLGVLKTYRVQFNEQIQKDGIQKTIDQLLAVSL
jgi:ABC-type transporter MlaC component